MPNELASYLGGRPLACVHLVFYSSVCAAWMAHSASHPRWPRDGSQPTLLHDGSMPNLDLAHPEGEQVAIGCAHRMDGSRASAPDEQRVRRLSPVVRFGRCLCEV
ncbi:hypothetical protein GQ53DRAFT_751444 [Thozetella sp. PMI_491]|nr:hypothetical protein GQ53DRAFT_751444 [Thozetella sp. PMI_491]